jgi:hypothetical protein
VVELPESEMGRCKVPEGDVYMRQGLEKRPKQLEQAKGQQ